ncbi:uncharacterized protein KY384_005266 [Bacidia gigantensis]|uniref:uncharacterized protein n=1 Tax=Bacidia gigantensis TaxID=2732470 RepID=UPI001D03D952|nr:uncharacterized protein KY384_005266 [Bacidia gigantensis]KAG8529785.1 hypothetical protein KY384_005266 [Bacidia gigantensis]
MKITIPLILTLVPLLAHGYAPIVKSDGSIVRGQDPNQQQAGQGPIEVAVDTQHPTPGTYAVAFPVNGGTPQTSSTPPPSSTPAPSSAPQPAPQPSSAPQPVQQQDKPTSASATPTLKPGEPVKEAAVDPTPAPPPPGGCPAVGNGVMTWRIQNNYGIPLSVSYLNNADSPSAIGCPGPAQMTASATTDIVFPTGWAGRVIVGKETKDGASLIEGSTTGWNDIDVSYVDGYSVPITCSNDKEVLTGCNIDLWKTGNCPNADGDQSICHNPTVSQPNGPATPFFQPCQGAAYTFPNDNIANSGNTQSALVTCCIGTAEQGCKAPNRQGKGNNQPSKREFFAQESRPAHWHKHAKRHAIRAKINALK